ncbi:MAG: carboxypeptidase-like regulatory domain-containing protein [Gemmatimonadota bacterium]|nr:carboxypeptidase-like regulatory domain-containing protein [Gemmatimonadota bacterium]
MGWTVAGALVLAGGVLTAPLAAQTATLRGRILDAVSGAPLRGATVAATTTGASAQTDSAGRYRLDGLKVGIHKFLVTATGYNRGAVTLAFAAREVMERDLLLDPTGVVLADDSVAAQTLPTVPVTAPMSAGRRFADFERRRLTGRGQYLTRAQLEEGRFNSLQDAMRPLRGIRYSCAGSFCAVQMARAPMGCSPEYIVDEREDNAFGPLVPVRDIQAVEVYTGAADVPGEFAGANAGCGVIVIWTANGRAPKRE